MAVVLTVRCTSPGGFNLSNEDRTFAHYNTAAKSNGYIGEDAVKKCHGVHQGLLEKLQFTKNLTKCPALGCAFKPGGQKSLNSKVKRHIEGIESWKV